MVLLVGKQSAGRDPMLLRQLEAHTLNSAETAMRLPAVELEYLP